MSRHEQIINIATHIALELDYFLSLLSKLAKSPWSIIVWNSRNWWKQSLDGWWEISNIFIWRTIRTDWCSRWMISFIRNKGDLWVLGYWRNKRRIPSTAIVIVSKWYIRRCFLSLLLLLRSTPNKEIRSWLRRSIAGFALIRDFSLLEV